MIPAAIAAGFGEWENMVPSSTPNLDRHSDYLQFLQCPTSSLKANQGG